jgi:uncharacterized membrane protein
MAKSSTKPHFSKKEAIGYGFKLAKENLFFFVALFVIVILISAAMSILSGLARHEPAFSFVLWLLQTAVHLIIGIGLINISLKFLDNQKPKYKDLFYYKPIINFFLASIIEGLIVIGGFILLVIPGIFFALRLQYTCYLVVDRNLSPIEAIKTSWKITRGNAWKLFFFGILLGLINILGFLCLIIGLFVTVPLSMLATTFVYRKLLLQSKAA